MEVKYLCKVYRVRNSDVRSFGIKYSKRATRIKSVNIPNPGICWVLALYNILYDILEILKKFEPIDEIDMECP